MKTGYTQRPVAAPVSTLLAAEAAARGCVRLMARSDVRQATIGGDSIQERSDMADIFVSYARSDRPSVQLIARALEASGRTVWWDREVLPGHEFETVIQTELDRASCVLVVWSSTSIASNWVRNEAALGR